MPIVPLIPPEPDHTPVPAERAILYPLWILLAEIKPYPGAESRHLHFSVDGLRAIPLPIKTPPPVTEQNVPDTAELLGAVPRTLAERNTRHAIRKGLGWLGALVGRVAITEHRLVYKLFWHVTSGEADGHLVDSRSGKVVPLAAVSAAEKSD